MISWFYHVAAHRVLNGRFVLYVFCNVFITNEHLILFFPTFSWHFGEHVSCRCVHFIYVFSMFCCTSSVATIHQREEIRFTTLLIFCAKHICFISQVAYEARLVEVRRVSVLQKPSFFACKVSVDVGSWPPGLINSMLDLAIKNQGFCSARARLVGAKRARCPLCIIKHICFERRVA